MHQLADDLAFDAQGRLFGVADGSLESIDASGRVTKLRSNGPAQQSPAGSLAPDARLVASLGQDRQPRLALTRRSDGAIRWRAAMGTTVFDTPRGYWSPDGRRLLVAVDGPYVVYAAADGHVVRRVAPHSSGYLGRQPFSPDGRRLVVSQHEGFAIVDLATGRRRTFDLGFSLDRASWSPDGRSVASGTIVADVATGRLRRGLPSVGGQETAWSPDSRWIAVYGFIPDGIGNDDQVAQVVAVELATGRRVVIDPSHALEEDGHMAWSAESTQLAYVAGDPVPDPGP